MTRDQRNQIMRRLEEIISSISHAMDLTDARRAKRHSVISELDRAKGLLVDLRWWIQDRFPLVSVAQKPSPPVETHGRVSHDLDEIAHQIGDIGLAEDGTGLVLNIGWGIVFILTDHGKHALQERYSASIVASGLTRVVWRATGEEPEELESLARSWWSANGAAVKKGAST